METTTCARCLQPVPEGVLVCHNCGAGTLAAEDQATERLALEEARQAMAQAIQDAHLQEQPELPIRDRFLESMFLPKSAELLIDEALQCQRYFREDVSAETAVPEARYRACLNRLELLAVDDPTLTPKIAVLARQLARHRGAIRKNNWTILLGILAALAGIVYLLARGVGALLKVY